VARGRTVADEPGLVSREIWQERPAGGLADASLRSRPWREVLRLIDDGGAPRPPVAHLCGRRLIALEEGRATLAIPASEWFCGPKGTVDSGMFAFLADMAHFHAVLSTLPAGAACTTAELSMTFLGDPPHPGGELTASSEVIYTDDSNALTVALVRGDQGQPVAHSTSRYFLFPPGTVKPRYVPAPAASVGSAAPDPVFRPYKRAFAPLDEGALDRLSGLEILQAELVGERTLPPIDRLTGIRPVDASDGQAAFSVPAHGWLLQEIGTVFGGMIALLAKSATAGAVQSVASAGTRFTALDLKVNFLRAVEADGTELLAKGKVLHRGSRLVIANTKVTHGGRAVAVATGTTSLSAPPCRDPR
jgi:uncharacterized protein (TIGR00369 family)